MTKQVRRLGESVATRRGFLGKLGWGAMAAAAALGGLLASPTVAQAKKGGKKKSKYYCCQYEYGIAVEQFPSSGSCPPTSPIRGLPLVAAVPIKKPDECEVYGW
jgi:hypothetical protein